MNNNVNWRILSFTEKDRKDKEGKQMQAFKDEYGTKTIFVPNREYADLIKENVPFVCEGEQFIFNDASGAFQIVGVRVLGELPEYDTEMELTFRFDKFTSRWSNTARKGNFTIVISPDRDHVHKLNDMVNNGSTPSGELHKWKVKVTRKVFSSPTGLLHIFVCDLVEPAVSKRAQRRQEAHKNGHPTAAHMDKRPAPKHRAKTRNIYANA